MVENCPKLQTLQELSSRLKELNVCNCPNLVCFQISDSSLESISLIDCRKLDQVLVLPEKRLREVVVIRCPKLYLQIRRAC